MQTNLSRRAFLLGATAAGIGLVTPSFAIADTTEARHHRSNKQRASVFVLPFHN